MTDFETSQPTTIEDERLAAIAQVAAGLSHECRGALQRIGASAEMLEVELEGTRARTRMCAPEHTSPPRPCGMGHDNTANTAAVSFGAARTLETKIGSRCAIDHKPKGDQRCPFPHAREQY